MIAVIHAYSRTNAGDGLLVDLTFQRLARAGIQSDKCVLFALDAASFGDLPHVRQVGVPGRRPSISMLRCLAQLGAAAGAKLSAGALRLGDLSDELHKASLIVAVGGGYLRTETLVSSAGTLLNHVPQLAIATTAKAPKLYLPQSIGPLTGLVGGVVKRYLRDVDLICARDDRTVAELSGRGNVRRVPDLAVLDLAEKKVTQHSDGTGPVVCVARDLGGNPDYNSRVQALARHLPSAIWAVQTEGIGTKHDGLFYKRLGLEPAGRLLDVLAQYPDSIVVSVRLHGALLALSAGVPAIHLAYQRKGWAAYTDLGLDAYVHSARNFDPSDVARQVAGLQADASCFWKRPSARYEMLAETSAELDRSIGAALG